MAVKYVKDFIFGPMTSVQRYAKGGHVTKVPAKAKPAAKGMPARAKPNAPAKGAKRMESPPKMGKGQGYKDGGKVPGKKMDRLPTKTPPGREKDLAPAKPFKGPNQGYAKGGKARRYAEGGDVQDPRFASIEPGAGNPMSARDQFRASLVPRLKTVQRDDMVFGVEDPYSDAEVDAMMASQSGLNQYGEADPFGGRPVRDITLEPYRPPAFDERGLDRRANPLDLREPMPLPPVAPTRPYDAGVVEPLMEPISRPGGDRMSGDLLHKWDDGTYHYRPQIFSGETEEGYNPDALSSYYRNLSREALAAKAEPAMSRAVRNVGTGRDVGLSDLMAAARAKGMMGRPGMFSPQAMYAKGGHVKGQAKVGKVMGEYKRGELHSGSKKGPLVKNPKQAVAIALSEARKSGAKIAKKAEGGLSDKELGGKSFAGRNEPLRGRYVSREEKIMREAVAKEKQKDMERKMREAYERTQSQSVSGLKKGGMARKGVPTHKAKAMYGGGKC